MNDAARIRVRLRFGQVNLGRPERYSGEISDMLEMGGWFHDEPNDQDIWDSAWAEDLAMRATLHFTPSHRYFTQEG